MKAMAESPDAALGRELTARLSKYCGETGVDEGAVQTLDRLVKESELARLHSLVLQPHMKPGESTVEAMARLFIPPAARRKPAGKPQRRR